MMAGVLMMVFTAKHGTLKALPEQGQSKKGLLAVF